MTSVLRHRGNKQSIDCRLVLKTKFLLSLTVKANFYYWKRYTIKNIYYTKTLKSGKTFFISCPGTPERCYFFAQLYVLRPYKRFIIRREAVNSRTPTYNTTTLPGQGSKRDFSIQGCTVFLNKTPDKLSQYLLYSVVYIGTNNFLVQPNKMLGLTCDRLTSQGA